MPEKPKSSRSRATIAFAVALILTLAVVLIVPIKLTIADYYAAPAIRFIQVKRAFGERLTDEEILQLEAALARAAGLAPRNPDYQAHLGFLQQIKISNNRDNISIEDLVRYSELASSHYRRAASLRPTWPYDWGDLALEESRLGKYADPEFDQYLARAARFGPWKNDTQILVAELGATAFEFLSVEARNAYLENLDRALTRQPERVKAAIDRHDLWQPVCDLALAANEIDYTIDSEYDTPPPGREAALLALTDQCLERQ